MVVEYSGCGGGGSGGVTMAVVESVVVMVTFKVVWRCSGSGGEGWQFWW